MRKQIQLRNFTGHPNTSKLLMWQFANGLQNQNLEDFAKLCIKENVTFLQLVSKVEQFNQ